MGNLIVTVACVAIPSLRPMAPRPSVVVALIFIFLIGVCNSSERFFLINSLNGEILGVSQIIVKSKLTISPCLADNNCKAWCKKIFEG